jgi:hypothetical protein
MKNATATLLLILVSAAAGAQPVYRCGSEYLQSPCPQGRVAQDVAVSRISGVDHRGKLSRLLQAPVLGPKRLL